MKSLAMIAFVLGLFGACNKPDAEDCRKAIVNMQTLIGTDNQKGGGDLEGEVRRCRGGSKKEAVACATKATSLDELDKCAFMTAPHKGKKPVPTTGSADTTMGAPGSAGSGSAATK